MYGRITGCKKKKREFVRFNRNTYERGPGYWILLKRDVLNLMQDPEFKKRHARAEAARERKLNPPVIEEPEVEDPNYHRPYDTEVSILWKRFEAEMEMWRRENDQGLRWRIPIP